jgi:hypothetical protein
MLAGPENHPDEYEHRLPAVDARKVEDGLLADLARRLAPTRGLPQTKAISARNGRGEDPIQPRNGARLLPTIAFAPSGSAASDLGPRRAFGFSASGSDDQRNGGPAMVRRSGGWTRTGAALTLASGAALFGAALVISIFGPKGGSTGAQPFIVGSQGPEAVRPSGETDAIQGDIDATRTSHITQADLVRIARAEELPVSLDANTSPASTPQLAPSDPPPAQVAPPMSVMTSAAALAASVAVAEIAALSDPARVASAPADASLAPSTTQANETVRLDGPQRPAEGAQMAESKTVVGAQPPPKVVWSAKLSRRPAVMVTVTKIAAATAPSARVEMHLQPQRPGASTIPRAPEPRTTAAPAAPRQPVNPMTHAFGARSGALETAVVDQTASKSGDWAIQFAAPKTEAEAEAAAARLNAKYAPALNGATIGVRKTPVKGEMVYALRVGGLSKVDATALCVRVKGRDCSTIK